MKMPSSMVEVKGGKFSAMKKQLATPLPKKKKMPLAPSNQQPTSQNQFGNDNFGPTG